MNTFFFNSENGDRIYNSESFREWLRSFFTNGIFKKTEDNNDFRITAYNRGYYPNDPPYVIINGGTVNIKGAIKSFFNTAALTVEPAGTYPRIDNIVIEYNENEDTRDIILKIEKGEYSGSTPYAPEPKRSLGIYQLIIAQIYVEGNPQLSNVTDCRNDSNKCGYVECSITGKTDAQIAAEFTTYLAAFGTEKDENFAEWFNTIKATIAEKHIPAIAAKIDTVQGIITEHINPKETSISTYIDNIDARLTELESESGGGSSGGKTEVKSVYTAYYDGKTKNWYDISNTIRLAAPPNGKYNTRLGNYYMMLSADPRYYGDIMHGDAQGFGIDSSASTGTSGSMQFTLNITAIHSVITFAATGSISEPYEPSTYSNSGVSQSKTSSYRASNNTWSSSLATNSFQSNTDLIHQAGYGLNPVIDIITEDINMP